MYDEDNIILAGYSIGSGMAAHLAANNHPNQLILKAPYFSLAHQMQENFAWVPSFLLRYNIETHKYLEKTACPVTIFHGENDKVIPVAHSKLLEQHLKDVVNCNYLPMQGHNGIGEHPEYRSFIGSLSLYP